MSSAQDECRRQTDLRDAAGRELSELAAKYEDKQGAVAELETKVKVSIGSPARRRSGAEGRRVWDGYLFALSKQSGRCLASADLV